MPRSSRVSYFIQTTSPFLGGGGGRDCGGVLFDGPEVLGPSCDGDKKFGKNLHNGAELLRPGRWSRLGEIGEVVGVAEDSSERGDVALSGE
jgi:hypothetical protein